MQGTETMATRLEDIRTNAHATILDIARREAAGKGKPNDHERLFEALARTGQTEKDYAAVVAVSRRAEALRAESAKLGTAGRDLHEKRRALRDHRAETRRVFEERAPREAVLVEEMLKAIEGLRVAEKAAKELEVLEAEQAEILGLPAVDLDRFTLSCGDTTINIHDPEAQRREVSSGVFRSEGRRRDRIMERARAWAQEAHRDAFQEWAARQDQDRQGRILSDDGKEPRYRDPPWRALVESGEAQEPLGPDRSIISFGKGQ